MANSAKNIPRYGDAEDGLDFALLHEGKKEKWNNQARMDVINDKVGYWDSEGEKNDLEHCHSIRRQTTKAIKIGDDVNPVR